jgi:hypothetical protein
VTKVNPTGSGLVYSTYLGSSGFDHGAGIAVDAVGSAFVTGATDSSDFPTTPGAFQTAAAGGREAVVTKLDPSGATLVYSTYLAGSRFDNGHEIAVDALGAAYAIGETSSSDFPTTPGAFQAALGGDQDAFVTKLAPTGGALAYSTYLGGAGFDQGTGVALGPSGDAYTSGSTGSTNFPTTPGAFQPTLGGFIDAFVVRVNAAGSGLVFATYLGGSANDTGRDIALDSALPSSWPAGHSRPTSRRRPARSSPRSPADRLTPT